MKTLNVSIVLYKNKVDVVKESINSVLKCDQVEFLYLIDNSPDNTLSSLGNKARIVYTHTPSNPGFGAAHNIAIKKSIELGIQYHLVLNPDVFFHEKTIEDILAFYVRHPDIGNIMPKVLYPNGEMQYLCKLLPTPYDWIGRRFNPIKFLVAKRNMYFELRFTGYKKIMEVPYLSGCFMFLNVYAIEKIGLFDENIFMYGEETDLCRRLIKADYKTIFFPNATIYHHFEKGSHKSLKLTWIGIRSAIYYFNKWGWFFDKNRREINRRILIKLGR